ncbi:hypothetical protein [Noviherbaspirillum aridicola]|uniref:Uncharacterized protein n=1 Tax=Noviherbaspirillum aridicola TaxID=2849687 RepID=A0ABQ4Q7D7_9BURK|nr:hypothetical protein [Noviherbaspirillum aridicola]GIZ52837.1 hypothetical protein NCCP691_28510 [Noviherbaspirillum aridicola]
MNPHIVLNFNLSADAARVASDERSRSMDGDLPTPFTAGNGGNAAAGGEAQSSAAQEDLPTPFDFPGGSDTSASGAPTGIGSPQARGSGPDAAGGGLPTPLDGGGGHDGQQAGNMPRPGG